MKYFAHWPKNKPLPDNAKIIGSNGSGHAMLIEYEGDPRDVLAAMRDVLDEMFDIAKKKQNDYTGDQGPFWNFEKAARDAGVSPERGFLVRMGDKMSRIRTLLERPPQVVNESIKDTLLDLANYAILLHLYIEGQNEKHIGQDAPGADRGSDGVCSSTFEGFDSRAEGGRGYRAYLAGTIAPSRGLASRLKSK